MSPQPLPLLYSTSNTKSGNARPIISAGGCSANVPTCSISPITGCLKYWARVIWGQDFFAYMRERHTSVKKEKRDIPKINDMINSGGCSKFHIICHTCNSLIPCGFICNETRYVLSRDMEPPQPARNIIQRYLRKEHKERSIKHPMLIKTLDTLIWSIKALDVPI